MCHAPRELFSVCLGWHAQSNKVTDRRCDISTVVFKVVLFLFKLPHFGQFAKNSSQIGGDAWLFRNDECLGHFRGLPLGTVFIKWVISPCISSQLRPKKGQK